jgi:SPOR domain
VDGELARAPDPAPAVDAPVASSVDSEEAKSVPPPASAAMPLPDSTEPKHIPAFVGTAGQVDADTSSRPSFSRHGVTRTTARPSGRARRPVGKHDAQADATPSSWSLSRLLAGREAAGERSSGGYTVQVTSQHSAAAAHTSFRALQAKFPNQLGGREPIVRRANLGAKGIYYRAMVGTFSSMEKAAGMCKTLKAAGGNCVIQRD